MFDNLEQDYRRYKETPGSLPRYLFEAVVNVGFRANIFYRVGRYLTLHKMNLAAFICERLQHHVCHSLISVKADIGPGFMISHAWGVGIGGRTRIGRNCDVRHSITIGGNYSRKDSEGHTQPWLEDNVSVGTGACILGPVHVGANSIIGANSVVTRDVPESVIVFGVPAQVIKARWDEDTGRKV